MGGVLNYHAGAPGCDLQHHIKPDMVDHGCNHSTHEVKEMSGLEVQGHPWLHGEFKTGLNLRDLISKEKQNKQTNERTQPSLEQHLTAQALKSRVEFPVQLAGTMKYRQWKTQAILTTSRCTISRMSSEQLSTEDSRIHSPLS